MTWKAWLEGDVFDLETLGDLFRSGDPLIAEDPSDGYYLQSEALQDQTGQLDLKTADALVKRINGVGRTADHHFIPVRLKGRYTAPDGTVNVLVSAEAAHGRSRMRAVGTVLINGVAAPSPPPKGPRYVKLASQDPDIADALRILGQPETLDWYDIYKLWEIVEQAVGGWRRAEALGWTTKAEIDRLTASANHPGISGDEARHARMPGKPSPSRMMTMSEADALVRTLVTNWIESNPSF